MKNKQIGVIFDMDGVIIDSNPLITKAWKAFFNLHQIPLSDEQLNHYVFGRTAQETVAMVFPKALAADQINDYANEVSEEVQRLYVSEGKIVPGFIPLTKELYERSIPMAIATSAPPGNVEIVLKLSGANDYIKVITDASQIRHSKPHPEVYLTSAERLGLMPVNCCVFEDSFSGIQSAKNAGMHVIGIATTHSVIELKRLADDAVVDFTGINAEHIAHVLGADLRNVQGFRRIV